MYRFGEGTFISMISPTSKNPVTPTIRKKFPNRNWTKISGSLESIFQGYVGEILDQIVLLLLLQRFNMKTPPRETWQFHHSGNDTAIRAVPMWVVKVSVTWRLQLSDHLGFFSTTKTGILGHLQKAGCFQGGRIGRIILLFFCWCVNWRFRYMFLQFSWNGIPRIGGGCFSEI